MTSEEYQKRLERAQSETFVIARTNEGFRIHAPANGGHVYYVTGSPEAPQCSCPDFEHHATDPEWRCKHILAVLAKREPAEVEPEKVTQKRKKTVASSEMPRMTLKRSVSPDGKIDALSVEFSSAVSETSAEETLDKAIQVLKLQDRIAKGFLQRNGGSRNGGLERRKHVETLSQNGPQPATIIEVGGMDGRWGRRLFLTFQVNGQQLRLFGSEKKLAQAIRYAGYPHLAEDLEEGMRLQLPCRVVTQPTEDGKYLNVVRVYRADQERSGVQW